VRPVDPDAVCRGGDLPPACAVIYAVPSFALPEHPAEVLPGLRGVRAPIQRAVSVLPQVEVWAFQVVTLPCVGACNGLCWWGCKGCLAGGPWWWAIGRRSAVCLFHPSTVLAPLMLPGSAGLIFYVTPC